MKNPKKPTLLEEVEWMRNEMKDLLDSMDEIIRMFSDVKK